MKEQGFDCDIWTRVVDEEPEPTHLAQLVKHAFKRARELAPDKIIPPVIDKAREFVLPESPSTVNQLISPNGMFKSRAVLRLWRSDRLKMLGGKDIAVYDVENREVWRSSITRAGKPPPKDTLAVGDALVSPNKKYKLKLLTDRDIVVYDDSWNEVWSELPRSMQSSAKPVKRRRPCEGWRSLQSKMKRKLMKDGIDSQLWTEVIHESDAPTSLKELVQYVYKRKGEGVNVSKKVSSKADDDKLGPLALCESGKVDKSEASPDAASLAKSLAPEATSANGSTQGQLQVDPYMLENAPSSTPACDPPPAQLDSSAQGVPSPAPTAAPRLVPPPAVAPAPAAVQPFGRD